MPVIQPVILSGGAGTRLWPASRATYPKQLLPLVGDRTMLQATALRLGGKADVAGRQLVICNDAHRFLVAEQLAAVGADAEIVLEPEGRNTAPAAALAAFLALREGGEAPLLLVMPADHVIENRTAFLDAVETGQAAAAEGKLVMFGVVPSYPHTGYGYIEAEAKAGEVAPIQSFVEKPDQKTAVTLLETNRFFWNSGIFLFRADTYLEELERYEPEMVAACRESVGNAARDGNYTWPEGRSFIASPSNSIDYAVMERTRLGAVTPMTAGWSDVGSWSALHDVSAQDDDGNAIAGDVIAHDCKSSYLSSASRLVAAVGLESIVVVEDRDAVLVAHKDHTQDVKAVVDRLKADGRAEIERHRRVPTPWGSDDRVIEGHGFRVRRLKVNPGEEAAFDEDAAGHWVVVRGTGKMTRGGEELELAVNDSVELADGEPCRIANPGREPLQLIAVQCGVADRGQ